MQQYRRRKELQLMALQGVAIRFQRPVQKLGTLVAVIAVFGPGFVIWSLGLALSCVSSVTDDRIDSTPATILFETRQALCSGTYV
jgi:hypothetical protein